MNSYKRSTSNDFIVPKVQDALQNIPIIFLLYIYIFQPPIINKLFYLGGEVVIFIFIFFIRFNKILKILKVFKVELFLLSLIIFQALFRDFFSGEIVYFDRFLAWGFQSFIMGIVVIFLLKDNESSVFNLLYWTGLLAAILSLLLILFPTFDRFYESIQIDSYYETYKNFEVRYRAYGISENLTFTYSFVMGLFAGYSFFLIKRNVFFIVPMLIFIIAMIFNARIGLVGFFVLVGHSIFIQGGYRNILKLIGGGLCIVSFLYIITQYNNFPISDFVLFSNLNWVSQFFIDIFSENNENSTLRILFNDFIIFPEGLISLLIGTGESLFGNGSDMGFILQIYYGGFTFLLLIFSLLFFCAYRLYKNIGLFHWFTSFFFIMVVVLNIKGFIFAATPGGRLLFFLYVYFIFQKYNQFVLRR